MHLPCRVDELVERWQINLLSSIGVAMAPSSSDVDLESVDVFVMHVVCSETSVEWPLAHIVITPLLQCAIKKSLVIVNSLHQHFSSCDTTIMQQS